MWFVPLIKIISPQILLALFFLSVSAEMELTPNVGSDRSWVWSVAADFSEGEPAPELLAIRFANTENAQQFKEEFDKAKAHNVALEAKSKDAPAEEKKD